MEQFATQTAFDDKLNDLFMSLGFFWLLTNIAMILSLCLKFPLKEKSEE